VIERVDVAPLTHARSRLSDRCAVPVADGAHGPESKGTIAMNPDQLYALTKLRAADIQEQARHARLVSGRKPEPVTRLLRARLRRVAERVHIARPSIPSTDAHDFVAGR